MEDGRGSSEIGSGKSIGLAEGILLPAEAVESNRSRPMTSHIERMTSQIVSNTFVTMAAASIMAEDRRQLCRDISAAI